jgi:hypothetical protein
MKKSSTTLSVAIGAQRANLPQTIAILTGLTLAAGILFTDSSDEMLAYLLVTSLSAAPVVYWIVVGAKGIPIMPAVAAMHFIYYGVPILRSNIKQTGFESSEILGGAATISLFLIVATLSWSFLLVVGIRRSNVGAPEPISDAALKRFMFLGLLLGVFYFLALYAGELGWLGANLGAFRSITLTSATVACFVLGHARARGWLRGRDWMLAVGSLSALVILSFGNLFLVVGTIYCLTAAAGYIITSRRVPWALFGGVAAVVMVLHAGKDAMREKYWLSHTNYIANMSVARIPGLMEEWAEKGLATIASGKYNSAIDRASLLSLLLRVQRLAPDYVPFLEGESYAVIPQMLVPRFINEDKVASQAAMKMLNVHFHFQTSEGAATTAVGWGLVAEGYGNFGYLGVIGVALMLGLISGVFERLSDGAPLMSLRALIAIAAMMTLINMEGDAATILTSLFQSLIAISMMFWLIGILSKRERRRPNRAISIGEIS